MRGGSGCELSGKHALAWRPCCFLRGVERIFHHQTAIVPYPARGPRHQSFGDLPNLLENEERSPHVSDHISYSAGTMAVSGLEQVRHQIPECQWASRPFAECLQLTVRSGWPVSFGWIGEILVIERSAG